MTFQRSKNSRQRGSHTHGWGAMKKHRGAGHRGGRGNAGSGKRGDAKKPSYWADKKYYGKHGFTPKNQPDSLALSLGRLDVAAPRWVREGRAKAEGGRIAVDLTALGFTKLLGSGRLSRPLVVTVRRATQRALAKVEKAGGKVVGLQAVEDGAAKGAPEGGA